MLLLFTLDQYAKVGKQDAAEYIQYGKLLKELVKEVKKVDSMVSETLFIYFLFNHEYLKFSSGRL